MVAKPGLVADFQIVSQSCQYREQNKPIKLIIRKLYGGVGGGGGGGVGRRVSSQHLEVPDCAVAARVVSRAEVI